MKSIEDECEPLLELLIPKSWKCDDWETVCSEFGDSENAPLDKNAFTTLRGLITTPVVEFKSLLGNAEFVKFIQSLRQFSISKDSKVLLSRIVELVGLKPGGGEPTEIESLECPLIDDQVLLYFYCRV